MKLLRKRDERFSESFIEALKDEPEVDALWDAVAKLDVDPQAGLGALVALSKMGSILSMIYIGDAYEKGTKVPRDVGAADIWYQRASDSGSKEGLFRLAGSLWYDGKHLESLKKLDKLVELDFSPAIYCLGSIYYYGKHVERNIDLAFLYFKNADLRGHLLARQMFSFMLRTGDFGLKAKLLGWFKLAQLAFHGTWMKFHYPESDRFRTW